MKLVFVTTTYPPIVGGAETYVQQFATHLAHHHHDVSVITRCHHQRPHPLQRTFTYAEPSSSAVEDGVRVHTIGLSSADKLLLAPVYRLHFYRPTVSTAIVMAEHVYGRRLEETGLVPDVVHYNGTGRELLGQAALRWARRHGAQFVVIPHTHPGTWGDSERDISFYKKADAVFIDTQHELAYLKSRGIPADRCRIVGNGIAPSEWTTLEAQAASLRERYTLRRFVVLFVGRRSSAKGYRQFLAAAPLVWRELTDVSFCLVGPPVTDEPSDGEPIMSDPRICDLGTVSEEVKHEALAACDILCLPSAQESFGRVVLEAWLHKKPVVAGPAPALVEVVADGGITLHTQSPEEIAAAIVRLLRDDVARQTLGQRGYDHVQRRYHWRHVVARAEEVYATGRGRA